MFQQVAKLKACLSDSETTEFHDIDVSGISESDIFNITQPSRPLEFEPDDRPKTLESIPSDLFNSTIKGQTPEESVFSNEISDYHSEISGESFHCHLCLRRFKNDYNLVVHKAEDHGELPSSSELLSCSICEAKFLYEANLKRHQNFDHTPKDFLPKPESTPCSDAKVPEQPTADTEFLINCDICEASCSILKTVERTFFGKPTVLCMKCTSQGQIACPNCGEKMRANERFASRHSCKKKMPVDKEDKKNTKKPEKKGKVKKVTPPKAKKVKYDAGKITRSSGSALAGKEPVKIETVGGRRVMPQEVKHVRNIKSIVNVNKRTVPAITRAQSAKKSAKQHTRQKRAQILKENKVDICQF